MRILLSLLISSSVAFAQTSVRTATFAQSPYMGWSSWSLMLSHPTEEQIEAQADAMIAAKLPELGYRYVNVDDGWTHAWDEHGIPVADSKAFPSGVPGLAKYLHDRGLKFGIYLNPGIKDKLYAQNPAIAGTSAHIADIVDKTQAGSTRGNSYRIDFSKPAATAYLNSLVQALVGWGVDFVKLDFVGPGGGNVPSDNREELRQWHEAIERTHRPIWLELSNFMSLDQAKLWKATSNGWRIENDIECYGCAKSPDVSQHGNLTNWKLVSSRFADVIPWVQIAGPGGWNDLDTLELGNGDKDGITPTERQTMFTFWAISCAPLYLGSNLTKMDAEDLKLIGNKELIAIDQAGIPARLLDLQGTRSKAKQAWLTQSADGSAVLAVFNLGPDATDLVVYWREVDALRDTHFGAGEPPAVKDLLSGESVSCEQGKITVHLESHASRIFRIAAR